MSISFSQHLLAWCQRYHWYGAEFDARRFVGEMNDRARTCFLAPPATREQVLQAETILGYSLPDALKTLYQTIANGGFGPAYGLRSLDLADNESLVTVYRGRRFGEPRTLNEQGGERLWATPPQCLDLRDTRWPRGLVPICNWGCGSEICVDCTTPEGQVIRVSPAKRDRHLLLAGVAFSFEQWLRDWLAREPVL